jgi:CubicO group peptidase (beta-lactamase class C family)
MNLSILVVILLFICSGINPSLIPAQSNETLIDTLVKSLLNISGIPSFSVAILEGDSMSLQKAYGYADVEKETPATIHTQYRLASVSKLLTVTAVGRLVDTGKLRWNDPIGMYLPDFPGGDQITPKWLAGHLSGIAHYQMVDKIDRRKMYNSVSESLETFKNSPRIGNPGEMFTYSSHGFTLLSAVVEKAANEPFLEYLETHIFTPLGMDQTGPDDRINPSPQMSTLYRLVDSKPWAIPIPENPSYKWGGGGMIGTPTDLIKLARGYLNGFLSDTTVTNMWNSQKTTTGEITHVGIGWRIGYSIFDEAIRHHSGSMGGARSVLIIYPNDDKAIATTSNSTWPSSIDHNAQMLMYAFQNGDPRSNLKEKSYAYSGTFKDEQHQGTLMINGNTGWITTPQNMKTWFRNNALETLRIYHLHDEIWALITPYGIMKLTISPQENNITGNMELSEETQWHFTLNK